MDNSHITGIGDNNHKLQAYAKSGAGIGEAGAGDVSVASFENSDIRTPSVTKIGDFEQTTGNLETESVLRNNSNSDIMVISPNYFQQKHIYTDRGQRVEQKTDTADNQSGNGGNIKLLYVHEDVMGNTRYHTKDNGQSYAELEYDIWGNPTSPNMLINNDNGVFIFATFTGHIYDTVLDIYFAEARFYDAKNRQWLSSDPMKDGLNWYQYVRANPATGVDPWGLDAILITQTKAVGGFGHMSGLVQDETGDWYFFYWGEQVKYKKVYDASAMESLDSLNAYLRTHDLLAVDDVPYDEAIYIIGDFTASGEIYTKLAEDQNTTELSKKTEIYGSNVYNLNYNLLLANCTQITLLGLMFGTLNDGTIVANYYEKFVACYSSEENRNFLETLIDNSIPVLNHYRFSMMFYNSEFTREEAIKQIEAWQFFYSIFSDDSAIKHSERIASILPE